MTERQTAHERRAGRVASLVPGEGTTVRERKGEARYVDVVVEGVAPTARDRLVVPEVSALPVSD